MKKKRQAELLSIISENQVDTQDMLQEFLRQRGYEVTQATISRDINELNIEKTITDDGIYCYVKASKVQGAHGVKFQTIFSQAVISIDYAMNIVSIKCHSGLANAACASLDLMNLGFIVGTIAGDDTIFVLVRTENDAKCLAEKLNEML